MSNLAQIGREIYEDGVRDGIKKGIEEGREEGLERGRTVSIIKILAKKLKEKNDVVKVLIEKASSEKLDEIEDKIFEITSWDDVSEILK